MTLKMHKMHKMLRFDSTRAQTCWHKGIQVLPCSTWLRCIDAARTKSTLLTLSVHGANFNMKLRKFLCFARKPRHTTHKVRYKHPPTKPFPASLNAHTISKWIVTPIRHYSPTNTLLHGRATGSNIPPTNLSLYNNTISAQRAKAAHTFSSGLATVELEVR